MGQDDMTEAWDVLVGDCVAVMKTLPDNSVDAIVTDPPYGLEFMGKEWDGADGFRRSLNANDTARDNPFGRASRTSPEYRAGPLFQTWCEAWAVEALRVAKPGAHLLAFGGTRTYHRLACALEDAGWEIRDSLCWLYGSGFPKSLDVSKAIDKAKGAEREVIGTIDTRGSFDGKHRTSPAINTNWRNAEGRSDVRDLSVKQLSVPSTDLARQWEGWGTALKPAYEPIILARKPLVGTVAANIERHGVGALNIDGCRIATSDDLNGGTYAARSSVDGISVSMENPLRNACGKAFVQPTGRWPANVLLDEEAGVLLDAQAPSTSRFFYCAKASKSERSAGVEGKNDHPTVKPIDLMRYLVRLVTPPGGLVLDPFNGSGTTGCAAIAEGFRYLGIEQSEEYAAIARQRIQHAQKTAEPKTAPVKSSRKPELPSESVPPVSGAVTAPDWD